MTQQFPDGQAFKSSMEFWTKLWQQQFEQNLKLWAYWAQAFPHETARDLAAEAEAMKSPAPRKRTKAKAA